MLTKCFYRVVIFKLSTNRQLENPGDHSFGGFAFQGTDSLIAHMVFWKVGFTDPPEALITAAAPEQVINGLNHFQVRHLSSHQGVQFQQGCMLSRGTLLGQRHSKAELI